ncbi:hypothetical protein ACFQU2_14815 [Siccirubricoccus deserti]
MNPAYNRERFEEAHDLIIRTWTQAGPFRFEGAHYQHRVVNPGRCRCRSRIRGSGSPASSARRRWSGRRARATPTSR